MNRAVRNQPPPNGSRSHKMRGSRAIERTEGLRSIRATGPLDPAERVNTGHMRQAPAGESARTSLPENHTRTVASPRQHEAEMNGETDGDALEEDPINEHQVDAYVRAPTREELIQNQLDMLVKEVRDLRNDFPAKDVGNCAQLGRAIANSRDTVQKHTSRNAFEVKRHIDHQATSIANQVQTNVVKELKHQSGEAEKRWEKLFRCLDDILAASHVLRDAVSNLEVGGVQALSRRHVESQQDAAVPTLLRKIDALLELISNTTSFSQSASSFGDGSLCFQ